MKAWNTFYDYLMPDVPDCPNGMANLALRISAQQFCERTLAWSAELAGVTMLANTLVYPFGITDQQEVVQLASATLDGSDLCVIAERDLPANWRVNGFGRRGIFTLDRRSFYVVPQQGAGSVVKTTVSLKPSNIATGVSDELFANYVDEIALGAKARLQMTPKKPYTDGALGQFNQAAFESKCSDIGWEVARANGNTARRTRASFF